jgi:multiple sugar transport system ATP-binding protein
MVFQNYALYPHMTVEQNIGFGLKLRRTPRDGIRSRVRDAAKILGLEPFLGRRPAELSGGQRQRVAMGRAMVREPKAFLMDEPLSNLDAKLRVQMRSELARLHERLRTTTVYVTHDQVEAMTLGERVAVLKDGVLQQVDTPQSLYSAPANLFVAAFIGSPPMNLVEARVDGRTIDFAGFSLPLPESVDLSALERRTLILGIRPSDLEDTSVWPAGTLPTIEVTADVTEELGSEVHILFRIEAPPVTTEDTLAAATQEGEDEAVAPLMAEEGTSVFCARVDARTKARPGDRVQLSVDANRFHYFDPETGLRVAATPAPTRA